MYRTTAIAAAISGALITFAAQADDTRTFLHTDGNQIVDAAGTPVRIAGVVWMGMETKDVSPVGLYAQNWQRMLGRMKTSGFNTIRLAFSVEGIASDKEPTNINFGSNADLMGKSVVEIMDMMVERAGKLGLRIILDCHRVTMGDGTEKSGLWYSKTFPETKWIDTWVMLAERYKGNPTVIGADLFNEPHSPATYSGKGSRSWPRAAEAAGNAILAVNSDWLIFVAGVSGWSGLNGLSDTRDTWWGQNLQWVKKRPIELAVPNRVVYTPHAYPAFMLGGYPKQVFKAKDYPDNMPAIWTAMFGYIYTENIAPLWVGEFGGSLTGEALTNKCKFNDPTEPLWVDKFLAYLGGDFNGDGTNDLEPGKLGPGWTWFDWGFSDCDAFLFKDVGFSRLDKDKIDKLKPLMFGLF